MSDGNVINAVKKIISGDAERRYIVVSAPGKRYSGDKKVTDLLYECSRTLSNGVKSAFAPVRARFVSIAKELNCGLDAEPLLDETERAIAAVGGEDFIVSRGEYLCARIVSKVLGAKFIDSQEVIFFKPNGEVDGKKTYKAINDACSEFEFAVFPGFYGRGADGKIKTFTRGGSDITGALIARAIQASVYENWTDVSGFFACDPRIIDSPKHIKSLSYDELRELSLMGANVLHSQSVLPVREANIPIQIKNTFRPQDEGTSILPLSRYFPENRIITGVSGKKHYTVINIEKATETFGADFTVAALNVLNSRGVSAERISACADCLSLAFAEGALSGAEDEVAAALEAALKPDSVRVRKNVSFVSAVGHGISSAHGAASEIFSALYAEGIEILSCDFGLKKISLTVGVDDSDCEKCIKTIYKEFF